MHLSALRYIYKSLSLFFSLSAQFVLNPLFDGHLQVCQRFVVVQIGQADGIEFCNQFGVGQDGALVKALIVRQFGDDGLLVAVGCLIVLLGKRLLKFLLSPEFQNCLARWNYGIPIRKSAVGATIDCTDPRDVLFLSETPKMCSHYHLDSAEIYNLVCQGIANLLAGDEDIDTGTAELAEMVRTSLKIRKQTALWARRQEESNIIYAGEVS